MFNPNVSFPAAVPPPPGAKRKKRPARWEAASGKGGPRPRDSRQKMIPRKGDPGFPLLSWDPKPYLKAPARPAPGGPPDHILAQYAPNYYVSLDSGGKFSAFFEIREIV